MDEILLLLARKNAILLPVRITTRELGKMLGMSQQNTSRRLSILENRGLISRSREGISLTKSGAAEVHSLYSDLKSAFEKKPLSLTGAIVAGSSEGRYYISLPEYRKQIQEKFGFAPYSGTLNLLLPPSEAAAKAAFIRRNEPIIISGFRKEGRTFGDLFTFACKVNGKKCALVIPSRTHHPTEIIEIVAPMNLRKALGKKDGDEVKIELGF